MTTTPALDRRVLVATIGALELFGIYVLNRLNLYPAFARTAGLDARGARYDRWHRPPLWFDVGCGQG